MYQLLFLLLFWFCFLFNKYVFFFFCHALRYHTLFEKQQFYNFGNEQNRSESEKRKRISIGIGYTESKPFRWESVICLIVSLNHFHPSFYLSKTNWQSKMAGIVNIYNRHVYQDNRKKQKSNTRNLKITVIFWSHLVYILNGFLAFFNISNLIIMKLYLIVNMRNTVCGLKSMFKVKLYSRILSC